VTWEAEAGNPNNRPDLAESSKLMSFCEYSNEYYISSQRLGHHLYPISYKLPMQKEFYRDAKKLELSV